MIKTLKIIALVGSVAGLILTIRNFKKKPTTLSVDVPQLLKARDRGLL